MNPPDPSDIKDLVESDPEVLRPVPPWFEVSGSEGNPGPLGYSFTTKFPLSLLFQ